MIEALDVNAMIARLIAHEGGYVDNPADRGGPTRFGITETVARAQGYRGDMRALPEMEAADIYKRLYWLKPRLDAVAALAPTLAAELFDTGTNMGSTTAAGFLRRALNALNRNAHDCVRHRRLHCGDDADGDGPQQQRVHHIEEGRARTGGVGIRRARLAEQCGKVVTQGRASVLHLRIREQGRRHASRARIQPYSNVSSAGRISARRT